MTEQEILESFKDKYCQNGKLFIDAWIDDGFINCQMNPETTAEDLDAVPLLFEGLPRVLRWFPRKEE